MNNRLSNSSINKYQSCPRSYKYHYIDRLRDKTTSAALLFGSAVDNAINALLKNPECDYQLVFQQNWLEAEINKQKISIPKSTLITYANSDFDEDLLSDDDIRILKESVIVEGGFPLDEYHRISDRKKLVGYDKLEIPEKEYFNYANWLCLKAKGKLMLKAYKEQILPKIKKVLAIQKQISISADNGDSITGFIDLVAEWHDGRTIVFDLKTSSIQYEEDSVKTSQQLATYIAAVGHEYNTRTAGYIVLRKGIIKNKDKVCKDCGFNAERGARHKSCNKEIDGVRCGGEWKETLNPEVAIQIVIDEMPEIMENIVLENYGEISDAIKAKIFPRNFDSCVKPWGPCPYMNLCHRGIKDGLEQM